MVPTELYTCYTRGSFTLNADGTGSCCLLPVVGSNGGTSAPFWYNNGTFNSNTGWAGASFSNASVVAAALYAGRVVSAGVRVLPQVAATSVPGTIYAGSVNILSQAVLVTNSTNGITSWPQLKMGYGALGATAVSRPKDPDSFVFDPIVIFGNSSQTTFVSTPVIAFTGFPASTSVQYEIVLNVEGIMSGVSVSAALEGGGSGQDAESTPSDFFPSVEQMWKNIRSYVTDAGTVDNMARVASTIPNGIGALANAYRTGRHIYDTIMHNSARENYFALPAVNRVIVEEVP